MYIYRNNRLISVFPKWYGIANNKTNNFSLARIEFFYSNDDVNYGLDIRHSTVRLPVEVKNVFNEYSKLITRNAAQKIIDGQRQSRITIKNENFWKMISNRDGEISFEINEENPFIQHVLKTPNTRLVKLMLKTIARELPIDEIISRQERFFIEETMCMDDISEMKDIYKLLYPNYTDEEISKLL